MRLLPHPAPVVFSAIGTETVIKAATDRPWRLLSLRFVLATSATVATRIPTLAIKDAAGGLVWKDRGSQAESLTYEFNWSIGTPRATGGTSPLAVFFPIPQELWIQPGWSVVLGVDAVEADDVLSEGIMVYALLYDDDGEPWAEEFEE